MWITASLPSEVCNDKTTPEDVLIAKAKECKGMLKAVSTHFALTVLATAVFMGSAGAAPNAATEATKSRSTSGSPS